MNYKDIIESRYNRNSWMELLHDIFRSGVDFLSAPINVESDNHLAESSFLLGSITLKDDNRIAVYEIKLTEKVDIISNKVGIKNLMAKDWKMRGYAGAFMFCFRDNESVLRFSYVSSISKFNEEGKLETVETDTKRYTYLLGEGHRSRTAITQFGELKKSGLTLADITKAFSVEALSNRFFNEYKEIYEDIVQYATGKRFVKRGNRWQEEVIHIPNSSIMSEFSKFENPEKAVRDYVKKLMGRIVFLQFLQKKGWLGVPVNNEWGTGDKEFLKNLYDNCQDKANFIDGQLELLFDDINTKRANDLANSALGKDIKIPYLNGGLFDLDSEDRCSFKLPVSLLTKISAFFCSYNFTIDENDPNDAEVGVDPEMLGHIFENLLEDNKDKGAFYTPKSIVQYMCSESLVAYLQNGQNKEDFDSIREFVKTHKMESLEESLRPIIDEKLKTVKICDPAIGSGAFPMGLLKELFECRYTLESLDGADAADIKKHIIQNNIYGVDIEKGAVDIARLRFWLSIVVDEKTPHALPNMDFKIVQGNSLIPTFRGKFINIEDKGRHKNSEKIRVAKKRLYDLQHSFFDAEGEHKKGLMVEIKYQILEIVKLQMNYEYTIDVENNETTGDIFNPDEKIDSKIDEEKNEIAGLCYRMQLLLHSRSKSLDDRAGMILPFFDWKIIFPEIFNGDVKNGFDIIIGNPPYFVYNGNNKQEIPILKNIPEYAIAFGGKLNAYKLFWANALKMLSQENSIICFICQNSFMADSQATNIRKYILDNAQILTIDSFPERDSKKKRVFESVKMSVCIPLIRNVVASEPFSVRIWDDKSKTSGIITSYTKDEILSIDNNNYSFPRLKEEYKPIVIKMLNSKHHHIRCYEGELNMTFHRGYFTSNTNYPVILRGAGVQRYYYTLCYSQGQVEYLDEKAYQNDYGTSDKSQHHNFERLAMQGMTGANDKIRLIMSIVPSGIYLGNSCNYILPTPQLPVKFLLGFFNSKLINWFFRCFSTNSNVNGYEIENIPIPDFTEVQRDEIIDSVNRIIAVKEANPNENTLSIEQNIDMTIYQMFGLSPDEITFIQNI